MTTESEADCIRPVVLVDYHNTGFKLVPLAEDAKTPKVESTNEIYDNPNYWSNERLVQEAYRFKNVATLFGKTHLSDSQGALYLNCLDIDSQKVYDILFNLQNGDNKKYSLIPYMQERSVVIKTLKPFGFHLYWLSHKEHTSIGTTKCKPGYEFEIKTNNSLGLCTLPPSQHRDDPNFHYNNTGQQKLSISDGYMIN